MPTFEHQLVELDAEKARQAMTGVHLRYVLAFGLAGIIVAFWLLAIIGI